MRKSEKLKRTIHDLSYMNFCSLELLNRFLKTQYEKGKLFVIRNELIGSIFRASMITENLVILLGLLLANRKPFISVSYLLEKIPKIKDNKFLSLDVYATNISKSLLQAYSKELVKELDNVYEIDFNLYKRD